MTEPATHPGKIQFVDRTAATDETRAYTEVPEGIAFVEVDGHRVPVVRVVAETHGDTRTLISYGADGAVLERTVQRRRP